MKVNKYQPIEFSVHITFKKTEKQPLLSNLKPCCTSLLDLHQTTSSKSSVLLKLFCGKPSWESLIKWLTTRIMF